MFFNRLRTEDLLLSNEDISKIPEDTLDRICFDRGIDIDMTNREQIEDLRLWLSISNLTNVPHSLLLTTRVNDFASENYVIDENEQQDEILRKVSHFSPVEDLRRERKGMLKTDGEGILHQRDRGTCCESY